MSANKTPTFVAATEMVKDVVAEVALYQPSASERQLKALFFVAMNETPICDWDKVTAAAVLQLTGDQRISRMWGKPGFKDWFCNKHELMSKAEYTLGVLLDSFLTIAVSEDPKSFGAKVQAAKVLAEITGKVNKGVKVKILDNEIPDDEKSLQEMVTNLEAKTKRAK